VALVLETGQRLSPSWQLQGEIHGAARADFACVHYGMAKTKAGRFARSLHDGQRAAVGSAFKRAEHRRPGEGEEVRVSERSEFPHRPSTGRGAQGTGAPHRLAAGGAFLLVTFLFARKEK